MCTNLPASATEYFLKEGESIVSTTDLKGNITYFDPCFIEGSGFTAEDLLGSPRNLGTTLGQQAATPCLAICRHG